MLVGRDTELATIGRLVDGARAGRGGALAILGDAGIGKTSLWRAAVAAAGDVQLLEARGVQSESELAFAGLRDLLGPLLDRRDQLPPAKRRHLPAHSRSVRRCARTRLQSPPQASGCSRSLDDPPSRSSTTRTGLMSRPRPRCCSLRVV